MLREFTVRGGRSWRSALGEQEVAGYRDAFDALMSDETAGSPTLASVLDSHRRLYGHAKSAGSGLRNEGNKAKGREGNPETGASWPAPAKIEALIEGLCTSYNQAREEEAAHPLLLAAAHIEIEISRPLASATVWPPMSNAAEAACAISARDAMPSRAQRRRLEPVTRSGVVGALLWGEDGDMWLLSNEPARG